MLAEAQDGTHSKMSHAQEWPSGPPSTNKYSWPMNMPHELHLTIAQDTIRERFDVRQFRMKSAVSLVVQVCRQKHMLVRKTMAKQLQARRKTTSTTSQRARDEHKDEGSLRIHKF